MTKVFDRRQKKRIPYSGTICLLPVNQEKTVMADIMDLSASGLRVRSSDSIKVNSEILCDIPIDKDRLALKGRVVWCDKGDHLDAGMGIEFIDLSSNDETRLSHLVNARARKHNSVKVWFEGMKTPVLAEAESIPDGIRLYTSLPFLRLNSPVGFKFYYDRFGKPVRGNVKRVTLNSSSSDPVPRLLIDLDPDQVVDLSGLLAQAPQGTEADTAEAETQLLFESASGAQHVEASASTRPAPQGRGDSPLTQAPNEKSAFSDVTPVHRFESGGFVPDESTRAGQGHSDPRSRRANVGRVANNQSFRSGEIDSVTSKYSAKNPINATFSSVECSPHDPVEINEAHLSSTSSITQPNFDENARTAKHDSRLRSQVGSLAETTSAEELEAILGFQDDKDAMKRLNAKKQRFLWAAALGLFGFGLYMALNSGVFKRAKRSKATVVTQPVSATHLNTLTESTTSPASDMAITSVSGEAARNLSAAKEQQTELESGHSQKSGHSVDSSVDAPIEERAWNKDANNGAKIGGESTAHHDIAVNTAKAAHRSNTPGHAKGDTADIKRKARPLNDDTSSQHQASKAPPAQKNSTPSKPVLRRHKGKMVASVPIAGSLAGAHHYPLADPRGVVVMLPKAKSVIPYNDYGDLGDRFRTIWVRKRETGGVQLRFIFSKPGQRYAVKMEGDHISVSTL